MNLKDTQHELRRKHKFILGGFLILIGSLYLLEIIPVSSGIFSIIIFIFGVIFILKNNSTSYYDEIKEGDAIVITGCDSGLGYSLALHAQNNIGIKVLAGVHSRTSRGAQQLVENGIKIFQLELTNYDSIKSFTKSIKDELVAEKYHIRALINNAGMMIFGEFEWQTDDQMLNQLEVNLLGTIRLTKSMIPLLRKENKSRLIIVTSHCALEPLPGVAIYGATKAALSAWSTSLRIELKKSNIDVINFIPGSFVGDSNILFRQRNHFLQMERAMDQDAKYFYQGYFQRYVEYISAISQDNSLKVIQQPELYEIFHHLLMEKNPKALYKCEPWRYWMYFMLFKISPTTSLRDYFVEKFVQMPSWKIKEK